MSTRQLLPSGGTIQRLSPTHVLVTGTFDELANVLAAAERGGRLRNSSNVVPVGEGLFMQNLRFRPARTTAVVPARPAPVPARRPAVQPRREPVRVSPRAKAIGIAAGVVLGLGVVGGVVYVGYEVYEFVARYRYFILGLIATCLAAWVVTRWRRDCEITHIRH